MWDSENMIKTIRNLVLIFVILVMLGFSLMVLSCTIPTDNAYASFSQDDVLSDGLYPMLIPGYQSTELDMYTDSKILSEVSYYNRSQSLISNSMRNYGTKGKNFDKFIKGEENVFQDHPHYWCGNLAVLRPLFYFIDYNSFRVLELFFELIMVLAILRQMIERNLKKFIVPFLLALFLIHPETIGMTIQYSVVFNIMVILVYALLRFNDALFEGNRFFYYFLTIGMATSFLDLLTYPLVSFAVPMTFYLLLERNRSNLKDNVMKFILFGLTWSIGYVGMWASKWVISSILLNENIVAYSLNKLLFRTSNVEFARMDAILMNLSVYRHKSYLIIFALIAIYYAKRFIDLKERISLGNLKGALPFLLVAMLPFVWYLFASNHSYIHFWFTYRELVIFFFAILCTLELVIEKYDVSDDDKFL